MDLHSEYMSIPTVDLAFHLGSNSGPPLFLGFHKTIRNYNALICDNNLDLAQAQSFRCLLCYQYQKAVELKSFPKLDHHLTTDLEIPKLSQLATLDWFVTGEKIYKDIMVLQFVLFSRATILESFESVKLEEDSNSNLLEIILSSMRLCLHLKIEESRWGQMEKIASDFTSCFETMIIRLSQANFMQTAKTVKLCLETFGYRNTIEQIWSTVLNRLENENVLNLLCFLTGNCLPEDDRLLKFFYDPALWSFYLKSINNPIPMKRKQANFMISKTLSMRGTMDELDKLKGYDVVPFIHARDNSGNTDPETLELKQLFLLTLDALEETQKQFALQAVAHLGKIVNHPRRDRLGIVWLKAMFQRALAHDSRSVVFQALVQALKLDLQFYQDNEMLSTVCRSLNEVRFYATKEMLHKLDLASWVQRLELGNSGIVPRLVQLVSEENLNLVVTFHIVDALRRVDQLTEFWSESTIQALMNVVKKNQSLQLNPIHFELERCALQLVMKFVKNRDLVILSDPLTFLLKMESNRNSHEQVFNWLFQDELYHLKILPDLVEERISSYINLGMSGKSTVNVFTFSSMLDFFFRSVGCSNSFNLNQTLDTHFSLLRNFSCRPYCDIDLVCRLIELMSFNEIIQKRLMLSYNRDITQFILQRCLDVKNLNLDQMMILINYKQVLDLPTAERQADFDMIVQQAMQILNRDLHSIGSLQYTFLVGLLGVCIVPTTKNHVQIMHLILKIYRIKPEFNPDDPIRDQVFSFFYQSLLRIMLTCATYQVDVKILDADIICDQILDTEIFEAALFLLQCASRKNTPLALSVLGEIILRLKRKNKSHDLIRTGEIIEICWKATLDCKKSAYFRPAADQTTRIIGQLANYPGMKRLETLNQVVEQMLRQGDKVPELKISLLRGFDCLENETIRTKIMLDCHVHGDVLRQDQIIEIQLCNDLYQLLSEDYGGLLKSYMNFNLDAMVRLRSFAMNSAICHRSRVEYLMMLLDKAKGLNKKRYFHNSLVHRTYLRILQTILLRFHCTMFENQQQVDTFVTSVSEIFLYGNHQTSVCMLLEWILTLTCVRFEKVRPKIWNILNLVKKEKPNSVQSILRVIYNLFRSLNKGEREHYAELKLAAIFTFCMDQNFSTRLHSQFVFKRIYESCESVRDKFQLVAEAVDKNLQSSDNGAALFNSMEQDFYLTEFNPCLHCNPECILYDIPRLTYVCSSEYTNRDIIRDIFGLNNRKNKDSVVTSNLEHIEATKRTYQQFDQDIDCCSDDLMNAQKKMMPWKSLNTEKSDRGLIVVASLVERVPNLGGIARTCEIFGAKKLVISNIEHVKNKEFLNLSVSAEKWLQIDQVKPNELVEYILQMKKDHYTIIGAEQTVNSVNLKDLTWPKNTVLILGHEKSGIPADVIPILDQCVEIPQLGIIRSLNVHVSAALCIWQYVVNNLL